MKSQFNLSLSRAVLGSLVLTLAGFAQQPPPAEPAPPRAPESPTAEAAPAAPAPNEAPATPPTPAVEAEKSDAQQQGGLRRIDVPKDESGARSAPVRRHSGTSDFPFGDHFVPKDSRTREAVSILGSTTVEGRVDSDAVSVVGHTTIGPEARIGGAAVAVLGRVVSSGDVRGEVVSVLGGVDVNGHVGGEVVSVLGDMKLGPKAVIDGDVVIVGGKLTVDPSAIVHGNRVNVPLLGGVMGDVDWLVTWIRRCFLLGRPLAFGPGLGWAWGVAFAFLSFYLVLALLFSRGIDRCVETLETRPGSSILASVLTVLLSPVAIVLLAITVVGALLIPFFGAGLFFAKLFGKAVMLAWIGRRFTKLFGTGRINHAFFAVLIGGVIVMLLYTIWGSFLLYKLLTWLGLGVVVYTIALSMKREKPAVAVAGGRTPPMSPPPRPASPMPPVMPVAPISSTTASVPMSAPSPMSSGFVGGGFSSSDATTASPASSLPESVPPAFGATPEPASPPPPVSAMPPPAAMDSPPPMPAAPTPVIISAVTLPRAGFGIRLAAMALDVLMMAFLLGFTSSFVPRMFRFDPFPQGLLLMLAVYAAVMWKHKGTTIGGVICGLKVVRMDHRELDWTTSIVRAVSCFLSLVAAGLGFIWVAFDDEKQSWHDKIAGTTVVRVPKGVSLL